MRAPRDAKLRKVQGKLPLASTNGIRKAGAGENGHRKRPILITGGAGFIGTNLADRLLARGHSVLILDNLSRPGSEKNLEWLLRKHGAQARVERCDVRDYGRLLAAVRQAGGIFHFAAQVAVTDSLSDPRHDFEINAGGTLNLLEAVRTLHEPVPLLFTSTNKVYGALPDVRLKNDGRWYRPLSPRALSHGIGENRSLDFHSPYGCSKGAADQYVLDYARTFRIPAIVFRMSCIYGPHQFGTEDQGWVAHFLLRACDALPITVYGDGMQVRDVLYVDDLLDAFCLAREHIAALAGQAFNIGGGPMNTLSLLELLSLIEELRGEPCAAQFDEWRHADQRYYVSDTRKFHKATGWLPRVGVRDGVTRLYDWLQAQRAPNPARRDTPNRDTAAGRVASAGLWPSSSLSTS